MKKMLIAVMMLFSVGAVAEPAMVMPDVHHGVRGAVPVVILAGAAYLMFTDEVQACDKLPIKTEKAENGNYLYDVAGCDQ